MSSSNLRVLIIAPFPPPITGNSLAVKVMKDYLVNYYQIDQVDLSKQSLKNGINSLSRIAEIVGICKKILVKKNKADVIYFTISESIAGNIKDILIYLICYRFLSKMIIHLHGGAGMRILMLSKKGILYKINKFLVSRLGGVIILGERHHDLYSGILPEKKIFIVPNFAEDFLFSSKNEVIKKFNDVSTLKLLFISNFNSGKGYEELLEAIISLPDELKCRINIDFAGGFESKTQKKTFLSRISNIPQIKYHGVVNGNQKKALFQASHVFCLPTYYPYEGQPISILEAYASGCFVMTTDHSGIFDIFKDGINGIVVKKKSSASIEQSLSRLFDNMHELLPVALNNLKEANEKYKTIKYNTALKNILENFSMKTENS